MKRGTAHLWKEAGRWVVQIELDGVPYTERDYPDAATAVSAIASMLRQRAERSDDLDQDACDACEELLDLMVCSQCGADGFVRTCEHGGPPPIRMTEGRGLLSRVPGPEAAFRQAQRRGQSELVGQ